MSEVSEHIRHMELGTFVRWGEAVTADLTRKILSMLPISQPEEIVEIPDIEAPSDEELDLRCKSY